MQRGHQDDHVVAVVVSTCNLISDELEPSIRAAGVQKTIPPNSPVYCPLSHGSRGAHPNLPEPALRSPSPIPECAP